MEQFGKKGYPSLFVEIVELAEDVVTGSVSIEWGWDVEEGDGFES